MNNSALNRRNLSNTRSNTSMEETCESDASLDRREREKDLILQDIERSSRLIEKGLRKNKNNNNNYFSSRNRLEVLDRNEIDEILDKTELLEAVDMDRSHLMAVANDNGFIAGVTIADKLRLAASKGQIENVNRLLSSGAKLEPDREGRTALHYAALGGHSDVALLLTHQSSCYIDGRDSLGYTALHRAAAQGHVACVKVLLQEGATIDIQDDVNMNAPLHESAWNGYSQTIEVLLQYDANIMVLNKCGFTALHMACQNGHNQSARILLYARSMSVDHANNYGDTPLHTAARYGHAGVTRILIGAGCNVDEQNRNGDTALHISAALKRRKIAKLLLDAAIDVDLRNRQNETAMDLAIKKQQVDILDLIDNRPKITKEQKKEKLRKEKEKLRLQYNNQLNENNTKKEKKSFFRRKSTSKKDIASVGISTYQQQQPVPSSDSLYVDYINALDGPGKMHGMSPSKVRNVNSSGTNTMQLKKPEIGKSVQHGVMNRYSVQNGVQYYRDLAGNVKQGPIGFAPICNCDNHLREIDKRLEKGEKVYQHMEQGQRHLADRIDALDRRTIRQVNALGTWTKDRLQDERIAHVRHLDDRLTAERRITHDELDLHYHCITDQIARNSQQMASFRRPPTNRNDKRPTIYRSRSDESLAQSIRHEDRIITKKTSPDGKVASPPPPYLHENQAMIKQRIQTVVVVDVHEPKVADSGSNPDSGYSSKIFRHPMQPSITSSTISETEINFRRPREIAIKPNVEISQTSTQV